MASQAYEAAVAGDQLALVEALTKCQVDAITPTGNAALHGAAKAGHLSIVRYLMLNCKANPVIRNSTGDTPLHLASRWGHGDIVQEMLHSAVDQTLCNNLKETPLDVATDEVKRVFESMAQKPRLSFIRQPADVDIASTQAARVDVLDSNGKRQTLSQPARISLTLRMLKPGVTVEDNQPITDDMVMDALPKGVNLIGPTAKTTSLTGAFFTGLTITTPGLGYLLEATSDNHSVAPCRSLPFKVTCHVAFATCPSTAEVGEAFSVKLQIRDERENLVPFASRVTLRLHESSPSGTLNSESGNLEVDIVDGEATVNGLKLITVGEKFVIEAVSSSECIASGTSNMMAITGQLAFVREPEDTDVGAKVVVAVQICDSKGNNVATCVSPITLTLASDAPSKTIEGETTIAPVNGLAEFSNITIPCPGHGYYLHATVPELKSVLTPIVSKSFAMTASLKFMDEIPSMDVGTLFSASVRVVDCKGAFVKCSSPHVALAMTRIAAGGVFRHAVNGIVTKRASNGEASFHELSVETPQTGYILQASSEVKAIASVDSNPFDVTARLRFILAPPMPMQLGTVFPTIVQVQDEVGRRFFGGNSSVSLTMAAGSAHGNLMGTTTLKVERGEGLFPSLTVSHAGKAYVLSATSDNPAIASAVCPAFDVLTSLHFMNSPVSARVRQPFEVKLCSRYQNGDIYLNTHAVTLQLSSAQGSLHGSVTQTADDQGIFTFSDIFVDTPATEVVLEAVCDNRAVQAALCRPFPAYAKFRFATELAPSSAVGEPLAATVQVVDDNDVPVEIDALVAFNLMSANVYSSALVPIPTHEIYRGNVVKGSSVIEDCFALKPSPELVLEAWCPSNPAIEPAVSHAFTRTSALQFRHVPSEVDTMTPFDVEVTLRDSLGRIVTNSSPCVKLEIHDGEGAPFTGCKLLGTTQAKMEEGRIIFKDVSVNTPVHAAQLVAKSVDNSALHSCAQPLTSTASLVFVTQPEENVDIGGTFSCRLQVHNAAGKGLETQMQVRIALAEGSPLGLLNGALGQGCTDGGGMLSQAIFRGLSIDTPGMGFMLEASVLNNPAIRSVRSDPFNARARLAFSMHPKSVDVSEELAARLEVVDCYGHRVQKAVQGQVTFTLQGGSEKGALSWKQRSFPVNNGLVEVSGLMVDVPHDKYTLVATCDFDVILQTTSNPFDIQAKLRFCSPPPTTGINSHFMVAVEVVDASGRRVPKVEPVVTLALNERQSPPGQLFGELERQIQWPVVTDVESDEQPDSMGIAMFDDLHIDTPGRAFVIHATSSIASIEAIDSPIFHATAQLAILGTPADGTRVWSTFTLRVVILDPFGDRVTTCNPTISLRVKEGCPSQRLGGRKVLAKASHGECLFPELLLDTPGHYCIVAQADNEAICETVSYAFRIDPQLKTEILDKMDMIATTPQHLAPTATAR